MSTIIGYLRQPTTLIGLGAAIGSLVYWYTHDAVLAGLAFSALPGAVSEQGNAVLSRIEQIEDALRSRPR